MGFLICHISILVTEYAAASVSSRSLHAAETPVAGMMTQASNLRGYGSNQLEDTLEFRLMAGLALFTVTIIFLSIRRKMLCNKQSVLNSSLEEADIYL